MPIALAPVNREMTITRVVADDRVKHHLQELGILVGGKITLVASQAGDAIVVVKEGRICLDKGMAHHIFVA